METNVNIESQDLEFFEDLLSLDNNSLMEPQVENHSSTRAQVATPFEYVEISEFPRSKRARRKGARAGWIWFSIYFLLFDWGKWEERHKNYFEWKSIIKLIKMQYHQKIGGLYGTIERFCSTQK